MPATQLTVPTKADYAELVLERVTNGEDYGDAVSGVVNYLAENPSTLVKWWRVIGERATKNVVREYKSGSRSGYRPPLAEIRKQMPTNWGTDKTWDELVKNGTVDWRDIPTFTQAGDLKPFRVWTDVEVWTKANVLGRSSKTLVKKAAGWKRIARQVPKGGTLGDVDLNPVDVKFLIGEAG